MKLNITAFLPCRKGSQRIENKNIRPFSSYPNGLLEIKLEQLLDCQEINKIIVSSNDERVIEITEKLINSRKIKKIIIDERPEHLGSSSTSTDEVIGYVAEKFKFEHLLWTHVTSPFVDQSDYSQCIRAYEQALKDGYDSLMTVQSLQGFIWNESAALNYDRTQEKWPRTQTLPKLYEIDSAAFIAPASIYHQFQDRIGQYPKLLDLKKLVNIDIDWPEQFQLAEALYNSLTR
ncbi:cytidylyltransferase domain-containing protein [Pseudomonas citronellolis]|uniref:acylneuraminate cytidylyltransferase family protein n=1 Tax=Pseudomonas citronellolis TaxID=53408 RepID=UPI00071869DB|nr:acylneuraminate cytidylyltransferase [Pseudomonas citronellolis]KRV75228.1 acylneuraminate cytidylyltransferase [Pseudomonas citronellolis]KRW78971.1 acylneuraminate cytidylyltransferase [Pseudomonas citronellolis]